MVTRLCAYSVRHSESYHRNTKKCAEKISSLEREVAETEGRMAEVRESLTALEEEARTAIDQQEQLRVSGEGGGGGGGVM